MTLGYSKLPSRAESGGRKEAGPVKCGRTVKPSACRAAEMAEQVSHGSGPLPGVWMCVLARV